MSDILMSSFNWLGSATAGVTVTAIGVWLLLRLCPVRSLAIQRLAWVLVLLPGVVFWRMSLVVPIVSTGIFSRVGINAESDQIRLMPDAGERGRSPKHQHDETVFSVASGRALSLWAGAFLVGAWLMGMIVLAARWSWTYWAFVTALPRPLSPAEEWVADVRRVCTELGLRHQIPLQVTEHWGPALCLVSGGYRLLVPRGPWGRFSSQQRRSILRHELAHYRRGDLRKSLLARLLAWPQWFNPLAWLAIRRFEEAAECACDDAAVTAEPANAFDYLRALLELGKSDVSNSTLQAAVHGGSLEYRVRRLLSPAGQDSVIKKLIVIAVALSLAAGGFARIRLASARSPAPAKDSLQLVSVASPAVSVRPPTVLLLANGGFEKPQEKSDDPEAWFGTRVPWTKGHFLLGVSSSVAHSGRRSVVVEIGDRHPIPPVHYNWTTEARGWQAGETYELSGWVRVDNAQSPAFIMAQCWNKDRTRIIGGTTTQRDFPVTGTTDWIRVSTRLNVPEGTSVVRIRAGLSSQDNPGAKAWFDDLSLVAVVE